MAVATDERVERDESDSNVIEERSGRERQNGAAMRGAEALSAARSVASGTLAAVGQLLRRRAVASDEDGTIPAYINPDEEERVREAEIEREWPSENIEEIPELLGYLGYSHIENGNRIVRSDGRKMVVFQSYSS